MHLLALFSVWYPSHRYPGFEPYRTVGFGHAATPVLWVPRDRVADNAESPSDRSGGKAHEEAPPHGSLRELPPMFWRTLSGTITRRVRRQGDIYAIWCRRISEKTWEWLLSWQFATTHVVVVGLMLWTAWSWWMGARANAAWTDLQPAWARLREALVVISSHLLKLLLCLICYGVSVALCGILAWCYTR